MFMSGPTIIVHGNADHAPGNTMDNGRIVIHGSAGDAVAHSMRGGRVYVRDNIGYRGGIHMKQYMNKRPILIVGGAARAFLGEYMAGGLLIVLGLTGSLLLKNGVSEVVFTVERSSYVVRWILTYLGVGAKQTPATDEEKAMITPFIEDFAQVFGIDAKALISSGYTRISPASARPFANKYTWE